MEIKPRTARTLIFFLAALVIMLPIGCGSTVQLSNPVSASDMTGNWNLGSASDLRANSGFLLGGSIAVQQETITAVLQVLDNANYPCLAIGTIVPFTGTLQSNGTFSLKSPSVNGQVIAVSGDVIMAGTPNVAMIGSSTYSVSGGCAANDKGKILGSRLITIDGVYTGTIQPSGNAASMVADLYTAEKVNNLGEFALEGTFLLKGSSCFTSKPMVSTQGYVVGEYINAQFSGLDAKGELATVLVYGNYTDTSMGLQYTVMSGSCKGDNGSVFVNF